MTRILVVDDEPAIARTLRINLSARGYEVELAGDGRSALDAVAAQRPDLVVLDLGLPDLDGVEVLRRLRERDELPVVVLSARHESDDKVEALDLGADDYVTKPFGMDEFMARVRAALRHGSRGASGVAGTAGAPPVVTPDFTLDLAQCRATLADGTAVHLTPTEWRFVSVLAARRGGLVAHADLLHEVWGPGYGRESNYLRVYANQIRRKLEPVPGRPRYLLTEPGLGYRLVA